MATIYRDTNLTTVLMVICILAISTLLLFPATQVGAETFIGSSVENRVLIAYRVGQAEIQSWLPSPWQVNPVAKGPLKEANLFIVLVDRLLNQDAEGKPTQGGTFRAVAFAVPAKNGQTGETASFIIRVFVPHENIDDYNPYKNSVRATIRREQTLKSVDFESGIGSDFWELRDSAGGMLQFQMDYQRAIPSRVKRELKPRSSVDPSFFRIYRYDQGNDLVKSIPAGIDRVKNYQFSVTISDFDKLFGGNEDLIGIIMIPWYVRQLFLP